MRLFSCFAVVGTVLACGGLPGGTAPSLPAAPPVPSPAVPAPPTGPVAPLPAPPDPCPSLGAWADAVGYAGEVHLDREEPCAPGEEMCGLKEYSRPLAGGGRSTWTEGAGSNRTLTLPGHTVSEVWPGATACASLEADVRGWPLPTESGTRPVPNGEKPLAAKLVVSPGKVEIATPWGADCALVVAQRGPDVVVTSSCYE